MEIPGFYYCPIKKKYFKDSPELKRRRKEEQENIELKRKKNVVRSVPIFDREFVSVSNRVIMDSIITKMTIRNTIEFPIITDITAFHSLDSCCILGTYRSCLFYDTNKKDSRVYNFDSQITSIQSFKSNSDYISISSLGTGIESGKTRLYVKSNDLEFLNEIECRNASPVWCSDLNKKMETVLGSIGKYSIIDWNRGVIIDFKIPKKTDILAIKNQNGLVYTGCRNGSLYILDSGYKPKYTIECGSPISNLIVKQRTVYSSLINGEIQEWDMRNTKKMVNTFRANNQVKPMPIQLSDGYLYASSDDGYLNCWNTLNYRQIYKKKYSESGNNSFLQWRNNLFLVSGKTCQEWK
ncbi:hypothetical protein HDV04_003839 [Boothiomyces sp. JEL0838]|nr:hypothetical protein HDV04_003839 [Boothiomyces sp. JEL0838]